MGTEKHPEGPGRSDTRRAERREQERRLMADAVEQLRSSEGWGRWLRVRRHFHRYSLHNQFLVAVQCADATRVAGFRAWLDLGYAVRKGEHGIRIWAPCPPSRAKLRRWREAGGDPDSRPRTFFRLVSVFDRAQVDPLPDFPGGAVDLDPPGQPTTGDTLAWLFGPLRDFAETIAWSVEVEKGRTVGTCEPPRRRIRVDPVAEDFSPNAQVATAIHEIAHALFRSEREDGDPRLGYGEEEVVVECVAYTVCGSVGLDTSTSSVPYAAGWGTGGEIERYATLVDRLARRLEDAVLAVVPPTSAEEGMTLRAA